VVRGDATFQVLDALNRNRRKRRQRKEFLVHGVRAIDAARAQGWPITRVVARRGDAHSWWMNRLVGEVPEVVELPPGLFDELSGRDEPAEVIAVAKLVPGSLDSIAGGGPLLVLDRPASPGNLGTLIRSADAFGCAGVVLLGRSADPFDPRCVRATQGSLFAVPVVELGGAAELAPWLRVSGRRVLGLDERGPTPIGVAVDGAPVALVVGNEQRGLAAAARELCDELVRIPMTSTRATSLNAAVAGSIALYAVTS
jgi:23S rRNA (uridine2479-2'-O)-methyltransferase